MADENILDIMREIDELGDGDKSALAARVEKMEGEIAVRAESSPSPIEPMSLEEIAEHQEKERNLQTEAAARGERPKIPGQAPRISDFLLIDTPMDPAAMAKLIDDEIFGNYDANEDPSDSEFGVMILRTIQGMPRPGALLPDGTEGTFPMAKAWPALIVKLDMGARSNYEALSVAMTEALVRRHGRRAWRCAWSIDTGASWVDHWRERHGRGQNTESLSGSTAPEVTARAWERWRIDVRAAFDDLMRCAQWEALRQWLILPEPRPTPFTAYKSFTAGKLLISDSDRAWIENDWSKYFPGRQPGDGALHEQRHYLPIK